MSTLRPPQSPITETMSTRPMLCPCSCHVMPCREVLFSPMSSRVVSCDVHRVPCRAVCIATHRDGAWVCGDVVYHAVLSDTQNTKIFVQCVAGNNWSTAKQYQTRQSQPARRHHHQHDDSFAPEHFDQPPAIHRHGLRGN